MSRSEIFEILSNDRRQYVIRYLLEECRGSSASLSTIVDYVAERENDVTSGELDTAQRKRVYTALRQCHLPKLDEYGVIHYDNMRSEVEGGRGLEDVQQYLDYNPETIVPWSSCYLGLSVITALAALLSLVGVFPLSTVPDTTLMTAIIVTFAVTAGIHTYYSVQAPLLDHTAWASRIEKLRFSE